MMLVGISLMISCYWAKTVLCSEIRKYVIQQQVGVENCILNGANLTAEVAEITVARGFFGYCEFDILPKNIQYGRLIFFLEEKLQKSETVSLRDGKGTLAWQIDYETNPKMCFVVANSGHLTYKNLDSHSRSKMLLKAVSTSCQEEKCSAFCELKTCRFYREEDRCDNGCLPSSHKCDKYKHCPTGNDEKCGGGASRFFLAIFLMGLISVAVSGLLIACKRNSMPPANQWIHRYDDFNQNVETTPVNKASQS